MDIQERAAKAAQQIKALREKHGPQLSFFAMMHPAVKDALELVTAIEHLLEEVAD